VGLLSYILPTFSFLPNVRLRLTLEYLTISPSSESLSFTLIHSLSSRSILKLEYITHDPSLVTVHTLIWNTLAWNLSQKTFDIGSNCTRQDVNQRLWYHLLGIRGGNLRETNKNEKWAKPHKRMTPPSTQNLKALGLWVFFLIYCQLSHSYPTWDLDSHLNT